MAVGNSIRATDFVRCKEVVRFSEGPLWEVWLYTCVQCTGHWQGRIDTTLPYNTCTLHYTTLHYTTLHYTTPQYSKQNMSRSKVIHYAVCARETIWEWGYSLTAPLAKSCWYTYTCAVDETHTLHELLHLCHPPHLPHCLQPHCEKWEGGRVWRGEGTHLQHCLGVPFG